MEDTIQLNLISTFPKTQKKHSPINVVESRESEEPKRGEKRKRNVAFDKTEKSQNEEHRTFKKPHSSTGVVSSLFSFNPELPDVETKKIKPNKEDVFAAESFEGLGLHPHMVANLEQSFEITTMTAIQKAAIPFVLSKRDALIKSQTGSGKTLAYAIPLVHLLQAIEPKINRTDGTMCIVIVPTRELAIQSYECFVKVLKPFTRIVASYLIGGEKKKSEKSRIRKGINILVGTPGRVLDHIESTKNFSLQSVRTLVIDEADRLLDMGYEKDLAKIIESLKSQQQAESQTIMLSATLSSGVERLAGLTLKDPEIIDVVGSKDDHELLRKLVIPDQLKQHFVIAPAKLRLVTLAAFVFWKCKFSDEGKVLIFMSTQDMVDFHNELFNKTLRRNLRHEEIQMVNDPHKTSPEDDEDLNEEEDDEDRLEIMHLHGSMSQKERTHVFLKFKDAVSGVLICTDVAARGLDLPLVHWIVQYSPPSQCADYVHRVGRTARIGTAGNALIFLLPSENSFVDVLVEESFRLEEIKVNSILQTLTNAFHTYKKNKKNHKKCVTSASMEEAATALQMRFEGALLADKELQDKARKAFLSTIRAYASYPVNLRHIFNFKALHLGHLAKSLALRETPSSLGARGSSQAKRNHRPTKLSRLPSKPVNRVPHHQQVSEFGSGLDDFPKHKRHKKGQRM